jgi:hypothetical protein
MKKTTLIGFVLCAMVWALAGCGGGGGDSTEPAAIQVTTAKATALANGTDVVNIQADVRKADGTAVADGTLVAFSTSAQTCSLSAPTAVTANGLASVSVTRAPVLEANNQTITVTGVAGSVSGAQDVKFVNQPASVDVFISLKQPVTNLASLSFNLINTGSIAFNNTAQPQTIIALNRAAEAGSSVLANFNAAAKTTTVGLLNVSGFSTGTAPIIKITFAVVAGAGTGLPSFSIDQTPANFMATEVNGGLTTPALAVTDVVLMKTAFDTEQ